MDITRRIVDLGLDLHVDLPEGWLEYPEEGTLLVAGGALGEKSGSIRPNVVWAFDVADSADKAFDELKTALVQIVGAELAAEKRVDGPMPEQTVVVTRALQNGPTIMQIVRATWVEGKHRGVVQVFATIAGDASPEASAALTAIVESTRVTAVED